MKKIPYFLDNNNWKNREIKNEDSMDNKSFTKVHNLGEKKENCAVKHAAYSIILAHNHPSGDPIPSDEDIFMTQKIRMCGTILDIKVLDHVIIGNPDYVSMKLRKFM
jgi:DNA repair protein RadC